MAKERFKRMSPCSHCSRTHLENSNMIDNYSPLLQDAADYTNELVHGPDPAEPGL